MKTFEETLEEVINKLHPSDQPYFDGEGSVYDGEYLYIKEAVKIHSKQVHDQAVDLCIENAETVETYGNPYDPNDYYNIVDKESLEKVKAML